jgi:thioredoxin reductase
MAEYDVVIIGSGLAGLTGALFAARCGLSTLVLEANIPGGHLINIEKIEDFPGFPDAIAGYELCPNVQRQAADQGAEFQRAEVQCLDRRVDENGAARAVCRRRYPARVRAPSNHIGGRGSGGHDRGAKIY